MVFGEKRSLDSWREESDGSGHEKPAAWQPFVKRLRFSRKTWLCKGQRARRAHPHIPPKFNTWVNNSAGCVSALGARLPGKNPRMNLTMKHISTTNNVPLHLITQTMLLWNLIHLFFFPPVATNQRNSNVWHTNSDSITTEKEKKRSAMEWRQEALWSRTFFSSSTEQNF